MNISQINDLSNETNVFGLQTNLLNKKPISLNFGMRTINNTCFYAKKGEPSYMKAMDADEDEVVSFEEFKDYCEKNGISSKDMAKMIQIASSYRTTQAQKEQLINKVSLKLTPKLKRLALKLIMQNKVMTSMTKLWTQTTMAK